MIKAVIIDVDDTLCLTEAACFVLENEVLASMGREPMSREVHLQTWGIALGEAIKLRSPGIEVEAFNKAFAPLMKQHAAAGKLDTIPEENYAAMDELIGMGMAIMLLTSRTHGELEHMLAPDHLLASRVETFYYRDNMEFHKPDPRAFDLLMKDHALRPEECVYVGDSVGDAKAAKGAGLHFIASLESGLRQINDFQEFPVDRFIQRFPDIVGAVRDISASTK